MAVSPKGYVAGGDQEFLYECAPKGQKVQLLTRGGVCVHGQWYGDYGQHFWAWAPLPKRNKALEESLLLK